MWQWRQRYGAGGVRVLWAPDGGSDGGNSGGSPSGGDITTQPAGGGQARTFTQDEVNAFVAERARHAKSSALSELLGELGFEKADELKAAIERARAAEDANKTELQKANERLAEYQKKEQTWAAEKREQGLQLAVQAAATKLGIVDAEVALALIRGGVTYDGAGQPQGVEQALTELAASKPYLKAGSSTSAMNPSRQGPALTKADIEKMSPEEINRRWDEVSQALEAGH